MASGTVVRGGEESRAARFTLLDCGSDRRAGGDAGGKRGEVQRVLPELRVPLSVGLFAKDLYGWRGSID